MFEDEIWKPIEGFEGIYDVSNCGRVRKSLFAKKSCNYVPGEIISCWTERLNWYSEHKYCVPRVNLFDGTGRQVKKLIPNLVAEAFLSPRPDKSYQVNHIDGNPFNNHVSNLEWVTHRDNLMHAVYTGLLSRCIPIRLIDLEGNVIEYPSMARASLGIGRNPNYIKVSLRDKRPIRSPEGIFYTLEFLDKDKYYAEQKAKYIAEHTGAMSNDGA